MFSIGGQSLTSRLFIGTALYPSPEVMVQAIQASGAGAVTASLRRQAPGTKGGNRFWDILKSLNPPVLPNTAGCRNAEEAITTAQMAREIFGTPWIKLEVVGDDYTLQPDPFELLKAATVLVEEGFEVFPYTTDDLVLAQRLVDAGCRILMPWAAPIGSGRGVLNPYALQTLRNRLPDIPMIVDAGLGKPSQAAQVMEMGFDGVLLNSAVALAQEPVMMGRAFGIAVESGRLAYEAGLMPERETAMPSTPTVGTPFWHHQPVS